MEAIYTSNQIVNPVDALWTLFVSQSKKVRKEFTERLLSAEANTISPSLAKKIAKAEKDYSNGKTVHFNNVDELDAYLDTL